jgi:hypothetical protein
MSNPSIVTLASCLLLTACAIAHASNARESLSAQQLQEDLRAVQDLIARNHPDLSSSTDAAALARQFETVRGRLNRSMTREEAWQELATLNPIFADGHLFIGFPKWRADSAAHLAGGGRFFPFEVYVDEAGQPFVRAQLGGAASEFARARIDRINGIDAREVARNLLARAHGDTPEFRAGLVSRRWWLLYWKLYGAPATYDLVLTAQQTTRQQLPGSSETPQLLGDEASFDRQFRFEILPGKCALLTIKAFGWEEEEKYYEFTRAAFTKMRDEQVRTLVVDVRENGGGDDDYWRKGILSYFAAKPYRWGSTYRKRVLEKYRDEGETVGEVVDSTIDTWVEPQLQIPARFAGSTYVLVGRSTYSSAVLFANVTQDFAFGTLAGTGGAVRSAQSGGVYWLDLPHSGLALSMPRFVLARPSGSSAPALVTPDLPIVEDPFDNRSAVDALLAKRCTPK